jgi:3-methyladenine DNA glycosylase AlkD
MRGGVAEARRFASAALAAVADPSKAPAMQAYMKTDMPFYGVQKAARVKILRDLARQFPPSDRAEYEALVTALWELPHREEKYLALGVARRFRQYVVPEMLPLYRGLIVEGAWWDLVDEVATHLIRDLVVGHPDEVWPTVDAWIDDDDMWLRRTAIICQVGAKENTDAARLFRFCETRAFEKEFFIRKAIGWVLRETAKQRPDEVYEWLAPRTDRASGVTMREAVKYLEPAQSAELLAAYKAKRPAG